MLYTLNTCFLTNNGLFDVLEVEPDMYGVTLREVIFKWLQSEGYEGGLKDFRMVIVGLFSSETVTLIRNYLAVGKYYRGCTSAGPTEGQNASVVASAGKSTRGFGRKDGCQYFRGRLIR